VSLIAGLRGQDAVVSAVGAPGIEGQTLVIDAAIAAGVRRFLPSEFGTNLDNPKTKELPVFRSKVAVQQYLEEKVKTAEDFTYTLVRTGPFLDWALNAGLLLDWESGKPRIYDGGDQLFSTTTLRSIGQAVVGVLDHPEETKNRAVYVQDMVTSQNRILAVAKKVAPGKKWAPVPTQLAAMEKSSNDALKRGEFTLAVMMEYVLVSIFGDGHGGLMGKVDNELLGVAGDMTDADIEAILKPLLTT
jgi:hypothetical protein